MAEIAENETTAAGTPNAQIHGNEETTPEPEQPQDEVKIAFIIARKEIM